MTLLNGVEIDQDSVVNISLSIGARKEGWKNSYIVVECKDKGTGIVAYPVKCKSALAALVYAKELARQIWGITESSEQTSV